MVEFEAALSVLPTNSRALSELGWVAFKAGKLKRSIKASLASTHSETDPRVAGASLYNLGRAREVLKDPKSALEAYRDSLARRPNQTVLARYRSLGGKLEAWAPVVKGCAAKPKSAAELCACFREPQGPSDPVRVQVSCALGKELDGWIEYTVDEVDEDRDRGWSQTFLGRRSAAGLTLIARLGSGGIVPSRQPRSRSWPLSRARWLATKCGSSRSGRA